MGRRLTAFSSSDILFHISDTLVVTWIIRFLSLEGSVAMSFCTAMKNLSRAE